MAPLTLPLTLSSFAFIHPTQRLLQHHPTATPIHPNAITSYHHAVPTNHNPATENPLSLEEEEEDAISNDKESQQFTHLCHNLQVGPTPNLLRLETNHDTGIRGLYPNSNLREGDVILSIPLSSCLRDDEPPSWLELNDNDEDDAVLWPTRLAASLVDLQLRERNRNDNDDNNDNGLSTWLTMLPNPNLLRASLPMHWSEDLLSSTKSVGLEMAVDMVYFARAKAIPDLLSSIRRQDGKFKNVVKDLGEEELEQMFQDAFDVVQTRCCAVHHPDCIVDGADDNDGVEQRRLRLVAPVFDFLNHGTGCFPCAGSPNAIYESAIDSTNNNDTHETEPLLVVRAIKDIMTNEEIFIDYGESAQSAWKCLGSYGFVPNYDETYDERSTAELYVDGVRAEVGGDNVPFELMEAASNALELEMEEGSLSPAVALRIAEKAFDFADVLSREEEEEESVVTADSSEEELYSKSLALSLKKYQSQVLRKWAFGLKQFAADQCMEEY